MAKTKGTGGVKDRGQRRDIYAEITDEIVQQLEGGTVPWHQPWNASVGLPVSMSTKRPYRGINVFLLAIKAQTNGYRSTWWGTYRQVAELGGQVRKGERSSVVVFWKLLKRDATPEERAKTGRSVVTIPMLRHFNVFNAEQCDGLGEAFHAGEDRPSFDAIAECERIVESYESAPTIRHGGGRAAYSPGLDVVFMPDRQDFQSADGYYSTLFHELTHSTGHTSRLARPTLLESHAFGDESYSKEELVAEMGAAMLSGVAGIEQRTVPQSAAYIASWLKALQNDPKLVIQAAAQAQKAADRILGSVAAEESHDLQAVAS